jgi:hypothetical protein
MTWVAIFCLAVFAINLELIARAPIIEDEW